MTRTLDVYLHRHLVGKLVQDDHGQMVFDYAESWLTNPTAIPLSQSLPLTKKHFNRNDCRGFFAGILPERKQARDHRPQSGHQRQKRFRHAGADRRRMRRSRYVPTGRNESAGA